MEERRLLLAVALSFLVLTGYRLLFPPPPRPKPVATTAGRAEPGPTPGVAASEAETPKPAPPPVAVADARERRVEIVGRGRTVAFSNRGARLVSWRLEEFRDERGAALELVRAALGGPWPLDLETGDRTVDSTLREALFQPSSDRVELGRETAPLRFEYAGGGIEATKELTFSEDGLVLVRASVRQSGRELPVRLLWGPGLGNPTAAEQAVQGYIAPQGVWYDGHSAQRLAAANLETAQPVAGTRWAGVETQYFAALLVPVGAPVTAEMRRVEVPSADPAVPMVALPVVAVPVGEGGAQLFVGAKDHDGLARLGHQLQEVVGVGSWIGPIVVPLLRLLRFVHGYVGNYGWAIVALTVLINLLMAPLRHLSIANGMKMAKMAPEMKVIQDRYRKVPPLDPKRQEMHAEMTALYARHGMNMGSQMLLGCLPLLLTMPFLFAFYRVLQVSIDLRGAPFLWIPDLSHRDPLFVTPVLMGVSMVLMTRLTPSAMDPAQQRIMMLMPLVLVVMFFAAPAGLNLYWLASNVCAIIQQGATLTVLRRGEPAAARKKR